MKKFLLGLVTILGMAVCFTACGNDDNDDNKEEAVSAAESGTSLYDSYKAYSAADAETTEGKVAKATAALSMYNSYKNFQNNKEDKSWAGEFAKSAASALAKDKTGIDENATATDVLNVLSDKSLVSEETTDKIQAVSELAKALNAIF